MATILQQDEEKDKEGQAAQQPITQTTAAPTTSTGTTSAAAPSTAGAPAPKKPASSGQFVDLGKFYDINKGLAKQGESRVADSLREGVSTAETQAQQNLSGYTSDLKSYKLDDSFSNKNLLDVDSSAFGNIFAKQDIAGWGGQGLGDIQKATGAVQDTESDLGRRAALRKRAASGYSQGEQNLDSILLARAGREEGSTLAALRGSMGEDYGRKRVEELQGQADAARKSTLQGVDQQQQSAREWLEGQRQAVAQNIRQADQAATSQAQADYIKFLQDTYSKIVSEELRKVEEANKEIERKNAEHYWTSTGSTRPGQIVLSPTNPGATKRAQAAMQRYKPPSMQEALSMLASRGFDPRGVSQRAALPPDLVAQQQQFEQLSSYAGADPLSVQRRATSPNNQEAAIAALRGILRRGYNPLL
jgi:hypothetical protein